MVHCIWYTKILFWWIFLKCPGNIFECVTFRHVATLYVALFNYLVVPGGTRWYQVSLQTCSFQIEENVECLLLSFGFYEFYMAMEDNKILTVRGVT